MDCSNARRLILCLAQPWFFEVCACGEHWAAAMSISTTSKAATGLAYTAALIFTLASASTNLVCGWHKSTDLPSSIIWAAVSLAVAIVFTLSWPAIIGSIERRNWSRGFIAFLALPPTASYSVKAPLASERCANDHRTAWQRGRW
jgi:hypothetical protein